MKRGLLILAAGAAIAIASLSVPATDASAAGISGSGPNSATITEGSATPVHGWHYGCRWGRAGLHRHNRWGQWIPCVAGPGWGPGWGPGPYGPGGGGPVLSDARLKTDVVRLATLDRGIGLYGYRFIGESRRRIGVMAQEVAETAPDAVLRNDRGYYLVDYAALFSDPAMLESLRRSGYQLAP